MRMPGFQHILLATQRDLPRVKICNKNWLFTVVSIQFLSKFQHRNAFSQSLRRLAGETCNCSLSPHRWNLCFDMIVSLHVMRDKSIYQRYVTTLQAFTGKLCINLHGSSVYTSPRKSATVPIKHFDPILNRSKTSAIPWVPCKRKVDPCKFLSVQKFVRTRANVVLNSFVFV